MKVEIVARTEGLGKYKGLTSEEIIAAIARHGKIKNDNGKLVKYLMDNKHWSPLDMVNFTFEIETSRSIGRQLLRHSSIKPQEHSTRYSDRVLIEPIELRLEHPTNRQSSTDLVGTVSFDNGWSYIGDHNHKAYNAIVKASDAVISIEEAYFSMVEAGIAKECAREFLPLALTTTISMNGSLRSWLAFLNVRLDGHTQKEARLIAREIGETLEKEMPKVFSTIDWKNGMFM